MPELMQGGSPFAPPDEPPASGGEVVRIAAGRLSCTNDLGGTTSLRSLPACDVRIIRGFWDYETGWIFHGQLLEPAMVELARRESTTGLSYDHYRARYPEAADLHDRVRTGAANFDPSLVYFSEFDLETPGAESAARPRMTARTFLGLPAEYRLGDPRGNPRALSLNTEAGGTELVPVEIADESWHRLYVEVDVHSATVCEIHGLDGGGEYRILRDFGEVGSRRKDWASIRAEFCRIAAPMCPDPDEPALSEHHLSYVVGHGKQRCEVGKGVVCNGNQALSYAAAVFEMDRRGRADDAFRRRLHGGTTSVLLRFVRCEACSVEERFGMIGGAGRNQADAYLRRRGWLVPGQPRGELRSLRRLCPACRAM
jgi:hypothetical protein